MKEEVLKFLKEKCSSRVYNPGEIIFLQGDKADTFYYLESGLSLTYTLLEDGRERNILITWPGRMFGISTFFEKVERRASAIALMRSKVYAITKEMYDDCQECFDGFKDDIILEISKDIGILFDELVDSSLMPTDVRVARFLCRRMADKHCEQSEGKYAMNFTQSVLASILGISRLSVNQALMNFSAKGWLSTSYGKISVLEPELLRSFAYESDLRDT